jgi:hypothetical protein
LVPALLALGEREADEIAARFPKVQRRVGGYNIDALVPVNKPLKLADILVGSEGTLAVSRSTWSRWTRLPWNWSTAT